LPNIHFFNRIINTAETFVQIILIPPILIIKHVLNQVDIHRLTWDVWNDMFWSIQPQELIFRNKTV